MRRSFPLLPSSARLVPWVVVLGVTGAATGLGVLVATDLGRPRTSAVPAAAAPRDRSALVVWASTARRRAEAGSSVVVALRVRRHGALVQPAGRDRPRLAARVRLTVDRPLRAGLTARLLPASTRSTRAVLRVGSAPGSRPGTYRVRVRASARPYGPGDRRVRRAQAVVTVVLTRPRVRRIMIAGTVPGTLAPGVAAAIDARVSNPYGWAVRIRSLRVAVTAVHAPAAGPGRPCSADDFTTSSMSPGPTPPVVPARATRALSAVAMPRARWPRVAMRDRAADQAGCRGATVSLRFTGTATDGPR